MPRPGERLGAVVTLFAFLWLARLCLRPMNHNPALVKSR